MPNVIRASTIPEYVYDAYNTQSKRRGFPASYFLLVDSTGNRKFPFRDPKSGAIHCGLLRAAMSRAGQYKYQDVEERARNIYEKSCKEKEKEFHLKLSEMRGEEVFGIVYAPDEKDADGDEMSAEVIMTACYEYNTFFRNTMYRHKMPLNGDQVVLLESYIAPIDMKINELDVKAGSWLQRWQIKDPSLQEQIKNGEIVGFSLGGFVIIDDASSSA